MPPDARSVLGVGGRTISGRARLRMGMRIMLRNNGVGGLCREHDPPPSGVGLRRGRGRTPGGLRAFMDTRGVRARVGQEAGMADIPRA